MNCLKILRSSNQPKQTAALLKTRTLFTSAPSLSQDEQPHVQENCTAELPSEPVRVSRRRRKFHEWVKNDGDKFTRSSEGTTNYLGANPFPNNPLFQPRPPLSDAKREELYQLYVSDPNTWSIRQLAVRFGYSLKRIEAILKLKVTEKEQEAKGVPLQRQFTKGMEQYMGADQPVEQLQEPLIDIFPNVGKPRMQMLEESATFTTKDASEVLNRKPYRQLEKRAIALEEAKFESHETLRQGGSKYLILDTSKSNN
ncbi:hypothetical protein DM01DRAFT_1387080 [Hesseltinella vesiculosa]|uniref:Uncharacterized protein n=1 Tax=Hesseltinella vesiculosa TaxID=101127 RepID=A0A1X2G363_9FUNG|nr:hypothetical protein DM01DRAFT_1387080 [Hesseltinella vesiculosa]